MRVGHGRRQGCNIKKRYDQRGWQSLCLLWGSVLAFVYFFLYFFLVKNTSDG